MQIVFHAFGMPFNGETIHKGGLGGSESAAYYLAKGLAARGHDVKVWTDSREDGEFDGVNYYWLGPITEETPQGKRFTHYASQTPHDVLIMQRMQKCFARRWASKVNIWQLHDLALHRMSPSVPEHTHAIDVVTGVSQFHVEQVESVWPINRSVLRVVPNGVDLSLYEGPIQLSEDTGRCVADARSLGGLLMLYQARPERGLENLLRPGGIMSQLAQAGSNAKLIICGYSNTTPEMAPYYQQLSSWGMSLPNVVDLGHLPKKELASLQRSVDLMLYPTEFEEVSCISVMEAQAAHLPVLSSAHGALPETLKGPTGAKLLPLKNGKADGDAFVREVLSLEAELADPDRAECSQLAKMAEGQRATAHRVDWSRAVDQLEAVIDDAFARRRSRSTALRHCIRHSDVDLARKILDEQSELADFYRPEDKGDPIEVRVRREIETLYQFTESDGAYFDHYKKHGDAYYESEFAGTGEDVTASSRWRATYSLVRKALKGRKEFRLLDFGAAHGHYVLPIAAQYPHATFIGLDINGKAVEAANGEAKRLNLRHCQFLHGGEDALDRDQIGRFDVIIAAEVLEHARDYRRLLERLRSMLTIDGQLILTTPFGPWEWQGMEPFKEAREHLRHFERQDLLDLFGGMDHEILAAPARPAATGEALGSWVSRVQPGGVPFGEIDYRRKLTYLAPRQTISACLIVKDAEQTLARGLDSVAPYVDEVLIGVDESTTDDTRGEVQAFIERNPWLPVQMFTIKSPLEIGFDEARNSVHDKASGDWILWFDADEECLNAWRFNELARNSMHDGFNVSQIHYSAEPPAVLSTDFPCRLYRRDAGVRMYGVVHEHPETQIGEAVGTSAVRKDIKFCHSGYQTEAKRRGRYQRNYPLLLRDREKYPDRLLNRFLYLRDIAQGLSFELEQTGGQVVDGQRERAQEVVELFDDLLKEKKPVSRFLIDSLQYYGTAARILGPTFEANVTMQTRKDNLQAATEVRGTFAKPAHFQQLIDRLITEATQFYESRYF